ncbi:MAG: alpha/beta hydrolase family protein [Chthoniobacterales bacterium]
MNAPPPASDMPRTDDLPFQTPVAALHAGLKKRRARRTSLGIEIDELLANHHHSLKKEESRLYNNTPEFWPWKKKVQGLLREQLIVPGALGQPSNPVLKKRIEHADFIEERMEISVTNNLRAGAIVTIPKNGKKKHPAVILLHSLGSNVLYGKQKFLEYPGEPVHLTEYRQACYAGKSLLAEFAKAGFLCISIDALGFGRRTLAASQDFAAFDEARKKADTPASEELSIQIVTDQGDQWSRGFRSVGLSIAAVTATDDMRAVDYLCTRDDVDTERIGCAGLSFGSFRANYLAALDDRVKAAVSACWISTQRGIVDYNIRFSMGHFANPPLFYNRFDMVDIILCAAPKPFLGISGWGDTLMEPCGIAEAHLAMREAWKAAGAESNLGSLVLDAGHEFNIDMQEQAKAFLHRAFVGNPG